MKTRTSRSLHCFHLPYDFDSIYCIVCLFCANIKMSRINFFALLNFPEIQDSEKLCSRGQRSKKSFCITSALFVGPLISLFWTLADVCAAGFQSQDEPLCLPVLPTAHDSSECDTWQPLG